MTNENYKKLPFLEMVYGQDAYATPSFCGIIYGYELYAIRDKPAELKKLILAKLKTAYDEEVRKINEFK